MSRQLINEYRAELDRLRAVSGSRRESVLREAFKDLLKRWGRAHDLQFVAEHDILTKQMTRIYVDGALLHGLRVPFGYWEAKDESDDLEKEIAGKFRKGYPKDNIVFTDDRTAVLWQDGAEVMRADMQADDDSLLTLLTRFFDHERQEIADFNKAVRQFATDLPAILNALRDRIAEKHAASSAFARALADFLKHSREAINPAVSEDDVREMLIQHILTEDIFAKVFNDPEFHRKNNVAAELYKLEDKLFDRGEKATLLKALDPYYAGIASTAALIQSHSEKQGFLKALYENFYRVYNPLAADRLGVVYTPGEIVRFMIRSADWLCEKHFGKNLVDRGVEILDPATGTGTFVVELLEHFRGSPQKLVHKYKEEIHANEIAILPYYVANLNIEATYAALARGFREFENLCFVDTLELVEALETSAGHQHDLLGSIAAENYGRIKRQNTRHISVIVGNPPYNANQESENQDNKNLTYPHIDGRIRLTYLALSNARKTKLFDPFIRFFRWGTDRLGKEGMIAFITNRSFLDARTFDGFRKQLRKDFTSCYVIDLGGDYLATGAGGGGNVFGIGTGVAISFFVRERDVDACTIRYAAPPQGSGENKLAWLQHGDIATIPWLALPDRPDGSWLNIPEADNDGFLPIGVREADVRGGNQDVQAIFRLSSLGVVTARDEWVWARRGPELRDRLKWFVAAYDELRDNLRRLPRKTRSKALRNPRIKLSRSLKAGLLSLAELPLNARHVRRAAYRPFSIRRLYYHSRWNEVQYNLNSLFSKDGKNDTIVFTDAGSQKPFMAFAVRETFDYHLVGGAAAAVGVARRRFDEETGEPVDNVTDWALNEFVVHYGDASITKDAIFHYVYAVLNDPIYREKYALNLKREFPRIPFYSDFERWSAWGEQLIAIHTRYKAVEPWPVERVDTANARRAKGTHPKPILKSIPDEGLVRVDEDTQITGIPREAWNYRLGSRSAIDWVLDQHKEKTPRDPTIREKFNTYRFANYKESMIALLAKVVRVSLETVAITEAMRTLDRAETEDDE